jgi:hypothetical protein
MKVTSRFVYLELVLLETGIEIFCDIFHQTHILNRDAPNTHAIDIVRPASVEASCYSTERLSDKRIATSRKTRRFRAEFSYRRLLTLRARGTCMFRSTTKGVRRPRN